MPCTWCDVGGISAELKDKNRHPPTQGQLLQLLAAEKSLRLAICKIMASIMTQSNSTFFCAQKGRILHIFSCCCMNILISSKWLYTAWCNLQGKCCKCQNGMFINAFSSVSMSKAFRSCKVLQLISFSDQQQTTQGEICSLWTWLLIFVERCTLFMLLGKVMKSVFLCVFESLSLDFPNGAFLTHRFSLCDLLMLTPDYIFVI